MQELFEESYDRKIEFCEILMSKFQNNSSVSKQISFSDEVTFFISGSVYCQSVPYWIKKFHTLRVDKIHCSGGYYWLLSDYTIFLRSKFARKFVFQAVNNCNWAESVNMVLAGWNSPTFRYQYKKVSSWYFPPQMDRDDKRITRPNGSSSRSLELFFK